MLMAIEVACQFTLQGQTLLYFNWMKEQGQNGGTIDLHKTNNKDT